MITMKFLFFGSLVHLCLIVSSSVMPQYGDTEQKQYEDFKLMSAFHKYLTIPTQETHNSLRFCVRRYYERSPIDCLNLLDRNRSNCVFKVIFWKSLAVSDYFNYFNDPTKITPADYYYVLEWISLKIGPIFRNCRCSDETKFKTELETISLMVNSAQITALELKSLGNNDKLISRFDDLVATCKYLIRNISIDFTNKTIDYYSLLRTFNEAIILVKTDSSSNGPSLPLSKRYALLWFYLRHIQKNDCNVIFDIHHHHKAFIIYLVMELRVRSLIYGISELYPNKLRFLFEKLYENGSQQLEPILELLRRYKYKVKKNCISLGVSKKISNYSELDRFITESSKKYSLARTWKVKALAELEAYLIQHGRKVDYSTE